MRQRGASKPEVANADEALREDVQQEAPEEFVDVERQRALSGSRADSPSTETRRCRRSRRRAGDSRWRRGACSAPGSAARGRGCQRAAWRRPPTVGDRAIGARSRKADSGASACKAPGNASAPLTKRGAEAGDDLPAKDLPQHLHRQKEVRARMDPPRPIGRQAARGHDAVDVRMMLEALSPRVQHHQPANRRAQTFRIARRPAAASPRWPETAGRRRRACSASASRASGSGTVKTTWT